ncbi:MAG: DMT family transporter [Dehalococcoidia bacterium]|nr:DMT family transporter [Dehalococcoidia bacterium]
MTSRQVSALLITAAIWGGSFLYIRVLVDAGTEATGVAAIRAAVGAVTLLPFAYFSCRLLPRDTRTWLAIFALGILNFAAPWTLIALGQEHIPSGVASIVNSALPFWTAIFTVLLVRSERLGTVQVVGLLVGFSGVVALLGSDLGDLRGDAARGIGFMLVSTALYGLASVIIRRWLTHVTPVALTIGQVGFASLFLVPISFAANAYDDAEFGIAEVSSGLALGALSSGIAVILFMWLIAQVGAVRASVVTYLMPPIGVFLGWAVLSEPIGWNLVAGLVLIASGVALVQGLPGLGPRLRVRPAPAVQSPSEPRQPVAPRE